MAAGRPIPSNPNPAPPRALFRDTRPPVFLAGAGPIRVRPAVARHVNAVCSPTVAESAKCSPGCRPHSSPHAQPNRTQRAPTCTRETELIGGSATTRAPRRAPAWKISPPSADRPFQRGNRSKPCARAARQFSQIRRRRWNFFVHGCVKAATGAEKNARQSQTAWTQINLMRTQMHLRWTTGGGARFHGPPNRERGELLPDISHGGHRGLPDASR